jgi:hypothetical protein
MPKAAMANEISEVTRMAIVDFLTVSEIAWSGRYTDDDFLARLYDLTKLAIAHLG